MDFNQDSEIVLCWPNACRTEFQTKGLFCFFKLSLECLRNNTHTNPNPWNLAEVGQTYQKLNKTTHLELTFSLASNAWTLSSVRYDVASSNIRTFCTNVLPGDHQAASGRTEEHRGGREPLHLLLWLAQLHPEELPSSERQHGTSGPGCHGEEDEKTWGNE